MWVCLEQRQMLRTQTPVLCGTILKEMACGIAYGNDDHPVFAKAPVEDDLSWRFAGLPRQAIQN